MGRGPNVAVESSSGRSAAFPPFLSACGGQHWVKDYGASMCAALANTVRMGWLDARSTRTQRVFRTMAAAIFSSLTRMVAVQAWVSSVPTRGLAKTQIVSSKK